MLGITACIRVKYPQFLEKDLTFEDLRRMARREKIKVQCITLGGLGSAYMIEGGKQPKAKILIEKKVGEAGQWYLLGVEMGHHFLHAGAMTTQRQTDLLKRLPKYLPKNDNNPDYLKIRGALELLNMEAEIFAAMTFLSDATIKKFFRECEDYYYLLQKCYKFTEERLRLRGKVDEKQMKDIKDRLRRRINCFLVQYLTPARSEA